MFLPSMRMGLIHLVGINLAMFNNLYNDYLFKVKGTAKNNQSFYREGVLEL